jgi:anti-sigma regulatory factor (Ser/Thr protein kinase)
VRTLLKKKPVFIINIDPTSLTQIEFLVNTKGYKLYELPEDPISFLKEQKETSLVVIGISNLKEQFYLARQIITDCPHHFYCCGIPSVNRKLIFSASLFTDTPFFLLPLEEKEFLRILTRIEDKRNRYLTDLKVLQDVHHLHYKMEWETANIPITGTCHYITQILNHAGFVNGLSEMESISLALEEALINSVDHGNLNLDSADRPQILPDPDFYSAIKKERLLDKRYGKKKITIELEIKKDEAKISIADEGEGFDPTRLHDPIENNINSPLEISGRGYSIMKRVFDKVFYNTKGNKINLIKYSIKKKVTTK